MDSKIEWEDAQDSSEEEFKKFLKTRKYSGLPQEYHKPEIFD